LVVFRGDPVEGGLPIGVVNDRELCLAAVRSAWADFQRIAAEERTDPVLREGAIGIERRLRSAAAELERGAASTGTQTGREPFGTPRAKAFCAREECGQPLPATPRQRGSTRKFCSPRCRSLAWRANRRRGNDDQGIGGVGDEQGGAR